MSGTKVLPCDCINPQQDKIHGTGMRVYNKTAKEDSNKRPIYRYTVCGKTK